MKLSTFKGGIYPSDGKSLSKNQAIEKLLPKGDLVYPLAQHVGTPAIPIVEVGEHVLVGHKIAEADGFESAPIFASVSGFIKAIEPRFQVDGTQILSIVIENDGEYCEVEDIPVKTFNLLTKKEILDQIHNAGVVDMNGVGLPTRVTLSQQDMNQIEYVIVNATESEPYKTSDYRMMLEYPEELVSGMRVVLSLFDQAKGIFAIGDNDTECIEKLRELTMDEPRMEVKVLKAKYPQGIKQDAGCIVQHVETLIAIHYAVMKGKPLTERIVTVSGDNVKNPGNFRVLIGTNQQEVLEAAGGVSEENQKIISGSPMTGTEMSTLDIPITKISSSVISLKKDKRDDSEPTPCINCGRCVQVCPSRLVPSRLSDEEDTECIKCGCCNYVCPARRKRKSCDTHIHSNITTSSMMICMLIALLPTTIFGIYTFGISALQVVLITTITAVVSEYLYQKICKKKTSIHDFTALVTGLLLALHFPAETPWWICVLGSVFAVVIVKQMLRIHPVLGARCFLILCFAKEMTTFTYQNVIQRTPLEVLQAGENVDLLNMLIGNVAGTIGETSVIAILIGAMFLIAMGMIDLKISGTYLISFVLFLVLFGGRGFDVMDITAHLCSGGLMLGVWFVANDTVTSPITSAGKIIYGICLGILTGLCRLYLGSVAGVSYAILLGTILVPWIEKLTYPKPFKAYRKKQV